MSKRTANEVRLLMKSLKTIKGETLQQEEVDFVLKEIEKVQKENPDYEAIQYINVPVQVISSHKIVKRKDAIETLGQLSKFLRIQEANQE